MIVERTALVTGANSGIGLETTIGLARQGIRVFMACRNPAKAQEALAIVREQVPDARLDLLELDLADPESVRKCAKDFKQRSQRIDILVNNAGIMSYSRNLGDDGVEVQLRTNHLSHFQLTALLIPLMPNDAASRIVSLSSIVHKSGKIRFDDLTCNDTLDSGAAYAQSKLACLVFAIELDKRLRAAGSKIVSVAAHPGVSKTSLWGDTPLYMQAAVLFMGPFMSHSPSNAAKSSLHAAISQKVDGGDYFGPQGFMEMSGAVGHAKRSSRALNSETGRRLWELSEKLTETRFVIENL